MRGRSCEGGRGCVPRRFGDTARCAPCRPAEPMAGPRASYGKSIRPPALDPRRRKSGERFRRHAREAACCLRRAVVRRQAKGAFRGGSAKLPARSVSAVASAMAGATTGELRQPELVPPAPARSAPAETPRALRRHAREATCCWRRAFVLGNHCRALGKQVRGPAFCWAVDWRRYLSERRAFVIFVRILGLATRSSGHAHKFH